MTYFNTPHDIASVSGGPYGQARFLVASSPSIGNASHLLYALEYEHEDNTAIAPDNYRKYNALVRYSHVARDGIVGVTLQGYDARWNSSDQIPLRAVQHGNIDRFGQLDPTDGGRTHRFALSSDYERDNDRSNTKISAYAIDYSLHLFSDFTYFLNDPQNMDQFEQTDQRLVTGLNASHTFKAPATETTVGYKLRNDNITPVNLFASRARRVLSTTRSDRVVETNDALFAQTSIRVSKNLRASAGLRGDLYNFRVTDLRPQNSGRVAAAIISPKFTLAYEPSSKVEVYANYGEKVDPGTGALTDPGTGQIVQGATPLVRAQGAEVGARFAFNNRLRSTVSLWNLLLGSELVFQGDAGTTSPGRPSHRRGLEFANFWSPTPELTLDLDYSTSSAKFTNYDPVGQLVPGSVKDVLTFGVSAETTRSFAGLRTRYFGPRPLLETER